MPSLEDTIALAAEAHRGQVDKGGQPYILHPLRLMLHLRSDVDRIVGVLHDVVEDTHFTQEDLRSRGYPTDVLEALDCLTKRPAEEYEDFIQRIKPNPIARRVKLVDLEDNMDVRRLPTMNEEDFQRLKKYRKAWAELNTGQ